MSKIIKCPRCNLMVQEDMFLQHLGDRHGLDVMKCMKMWKTGKGLLLIGIVFSIGMILGILVRGFL